jgi:hypothetical protein
VGAAVGIDLGTASSAVTHVGTGGRAVITGVLLIGGSTRRRPPHGIAPRS